MVQKKNIALCIILSIVTCGIYGIYWFITLTTDANVLAEENGTTGGMAFLLTLVTCGIYGYYWAYKMGERLDVAASKRGTVAQSRSVLYLILQIFGLGIIGYALMQDSINKMAF